MFETFKFKKLLKQYQIIFSPILKDMNLEKVENTRLVFKDKDDNKMKATICDETIYFDYINGDIEKYIVLTLPLQTEKFSDIKVIEKMNEDRPNGCVVEKVERIYGYRKASDCELSLVGLVSERYVFDKSMHFDENWFFVDDAFLDKYSLMKTTFESHINTLVMPVDSLRFYMNSKYSNLTLLNGQDISYIYDAVDGVDSVSRIYDLYSGIINDANSCDIFNIHLGLLGKSCFGYKETSGITGDENAICGCFKNEIYRGDNAFIHNLIENEIGYKKEFDYSDLESLLEAVLYERSASERSKEVLEKRLGMSYDVFNNLDYHLQQKIIQDHRIIKKKNKDKMITIIGNGEYTTFVNGDLSFESSRKRLNDRLSKVLKKIR